jgi:lipoyl-dependent peroxiredoxin
LLHFKKKFVIIGRIFFLIKNGGRMIRSGSAEWNGDLRNGSGTLSTESGTLSSISYNFRSRFEQGSETNPEELLGAAHAACFSMALANNLAGAGYKVNSIVTNDKVHLEKLEDGFTVTKIEINCEADVEGVDESVFNEMAEKTKKGCPVSKALASVEMVMNAKLK